MFNAVTETFKTLTRWLRFEVGGAGRVKSYFPRRRGYGRRMSTVQEIEAAIKQLSPEEMRQVRDWIENMLEDQLEFTEDFRAKIERSERDMAEGKRPRVG